MATHVAVRQRLIDANAAGGAAGYRLELVSLDDEGDPTVAARRAGELAADPLVVAVLAPARSGLEQPLASAGLRLQAADDPAAAGRPDRAALRARP